MKMQTLDDSSITASASDSDASNNTITYSLDSNAGGLFAINSSTGVVTVAAAFDYETANNHSITVRAASADGSFSIRSFSVAVADINEATISPLSDSDSASDHVSENASIGNVVGITAFATDADGTDSVTYSLDNDASGRFAIDAITGVITVSWIDRSRNSS